MKNIPLILSLAFTLAAFTGCKSTGPYTPTPASNVENVEPVVLMDEMVQRSVTSNGVMFQPLDDGRLRVVARIQSKESRRIQVQVQCVFKDANGYGVEDETPWQTLILTENGQEQVSFTSMNSRAKKATIRVRQAR